MKTINFIRFLSFLIIISFYNFTFFAATHEPTDKEIYKALNIKNDRGEDWKSGDPIPTAWKILSISESANESEINAAFKKLSLKWHPDKDPGNKLAESVFKKISEAKDSIKPKTGASSKITEENIYGLTGLIKGGKGLGFFGLSIADDQSALKNRYERAESILKSKASEGPEWAKIVSSFDNILAKEYKAAQEELIGKYLPIRPTIREEELKEIKEEDFLTQIKNEIAAVRDLSDLNKMGTTFINNSDRELIIGILGYGATIRKAVGSKIFNLLVKPGSNIVLPLGTFDIRVDRKMLGVYDSGLFTTQTGTRYNVIGKTVELKSDASGNPRLNFKV